MQPCGAAIWSLYDVCMSCRPRHAIRRFTERLTEREYADTPPAERRYLGTLEGGQRVKMQVPERYVNSSTAPNTRTAGRCRTCRNSRGNWSYVYSSVPHNQVCLYIANAMRGAAGESDVALRPIAAGEEITSDYPLEEP